MKKLLSIILSLIFVFTFCACSQRVYELPWDHFCYSASDGHPIVLEPSEKNYIIKLFNEGDWYGEIAKCTTDVRFAAKSQSLGYCIEDGVFNDFTLRRSLKLSEQDRVTINGYLEYYK